MKRGTSKKDKGKKSSKKTNSPKSQVKEGWFAFPVPLSIRGMNKNQRKGYQEGGEYMESEERKSMGRPHLLNDCCGGPVKKKVREDSMGLGRKP